MHPDRQRALVVGILFLITHVTSIGARFLFADALAQPDSVAPGDPTVMAGALAEVVLAAAVAGTGFVLHPIMKRHGEALALGYVALRLLEASVILTGVSAVLSLTSLAGSGLGPGLAALQEWTFIVGPGLVCPINTVVIGALLWRARLVPQWIPALGLVGGPLVFLWNVLLAIGLVDPSMPFAVLFVLPIFAGRSRSRSA